MYEYFFELPKQKITYTDVEFVNEHKEEATQVLGRGGQAVARGSFCLRDLAVVSRPFPATPFLLRITKI
jgi:hypothetical protein